MNHANYRKINDRTQNSSKYHKKDGTNVRAKLKLNSADIEDIMDTQTDVHTEHCCIHHGCKYGEDDCTVATGQKPQSYSCESCDWDNETLEQEPPEVFHKGLKAEVTKFSFSVPLTRTQWDKLESIDPLSVVNPKIYAVGGYDIEYNGHFAMHFYFTVDEISEAKDVLKVLDELLGEK